MFIELRENRGKGWKFYLIDDIRLIALYSSDIINEDIPHILRIIDGTKTIGYTFYTNPGANGIYKTWHNFVIQKGKVLPYSGTWFKPYLFVYPYGLQIPHNS